MWVHWIECSRELDFNGKICIELARTFHPINPHNRLRVSMSCKNPYHKLFSDLDLKHPRRHYRDFRFERFYTTHNSFTDSLNHVRGSQNFSRIPWVENRPRILRIQSIYSASALLSNQTILIIGTLTVELNNFASIKNN